MKSVFKYELSAANSSGVTKVSAPFGAKFLYAGNQKENICVWAEVDDEEELIVYEFEVFGTGHDTCQNEGFNKEYLGTVILSGGSYVFHIYQRTN
tara:strand:- start:429 stop:713 length:285 start_codon:yes stop_codon:yes gene_type:complete